MKKCYMVYCNMFEVKEYSIYPLKLIKQYYIGVFEDSNLAIKFIRDIAYKDKQTDLNSIKETKFNDVVRCGDKNRYYNLSYYTKNRTEKIVNFIEELDFI